MNHIADSASYFSFGWILWFVFIMFIFSSLGNWGYSYRAHRKYDGTSGKDAAAILNERYASGAIDRAQYLQLKSDIAA